MGQLIEATASPITGLLGGKGAYEGQKKEAEYADRALKLYQQNMERSAEMFDPYVQFGKQGLPMIMEAIDSANYDRGQALTDYYKGPEYAALSEQANRNILAGAEAGAGIGSSSTANDLMRIAPALGSQHLGYLDAKAADDYNRAMGVAGIGQSAAAGTSGVYSGMASQASNLMLNKGQALAAKKAMPWMIAADQNKRAAEGAGAFADFFGGMFTGGMPMGGF